MTKLEEAREIRESERRRYLSVNSSVYEDAEQRWKKYEQLILNRYYPGEFPVEDEQKTIDQAWAERDRRRSLPNIR